MASRWALQDAKNRFSEVVTKALTEGPQTVTRHGRDAVVVVSAEEYRQAVKTRPSLAQALLNSPLRGAALDLSREGDALHGPLDLG